MSFGEVNCSRLISALLSLEKVVLPNKATVRLR